MVLKKGILTCYEILAAGGATGQWTAPLTNRIGTHPVHAPGERFVKTKHGGTITHSPAADYWARTAYHWRAISAANEFLASGHHHANAAA